MTVSVSNLISPLSPTALRISTHQYCQKNSKLYIIQYSTQQSYYNFGSGSNMADDDITAEPKQINISFLDSSQIYVHVMPHIYI